MSEFSTKSFLDTVESIRDEMSRVGACASDEEPTLAVVDAADDLPAGWVRIYDDGAEVFCNAEHALAALSALPDDADYMDDFWGALCGDGFRDQCDWGWRDLGDLVDSASGEEGGAVVRLRCNGGWQYTATNDGLNTDAVSEAFRYGAWCDTAEQAIDAYGDGCVSMEDVPSSWGDV